MVAVQLFLGEDDLLRQLIQPGVLQGDLLCIRQGDKLRYADGGCVRVLLQIQQLIQRHTGNLIGGQACLIRCGKDPVGTPEGNMVFLRDFRSLDVFGRYGMEHQRTDGFGLLQGLLNLR